MIVYVEICKEYIQELLELMNELIQVTRCKANILKNQSDFYILAINN